MAGTDARLLPIVEFHDIRAEKGNADRYLELIEGPLAASFVGAGGAMMGQFRVENHPDRVVLLRGFPSMLARRAGTRDVPQKRRMAGQSRGCFGPDSRDNAVILTPHAHRLERHAPLRPGDGYTAHRSRNCDSPSRSGNYHLWLRLLLRKAGLDPLAAFATLESVNDVPAVPVVRNRTHHIALLPQGGGVPPLPPELRDMLRFAPEILSLSAGPGAGVVTNDTGLTIMRRPGNGGGDIW